MSRAAADRIGVGVGPLRVHVDQAHLHRAERGGEVPLAAVALVAEPRVLRAPEDLVGLPHVGAPEAEPERLEPHRLQRAVAREDDQVGPRDLPAVLLLDRPQQPARLVEVGVVGPAVERGEALRAAAATAPAVGDAVGAGGVPRHPDEQRPVVAVVGRPPVLRRRHHVERRPASTRRRRRSRTPPRSRSRRPAASAGARAGRAPRGRAGSATSPGSCAADPAWEWGRR